MYAAGSGVDIELPLPAGPTAHSRDLLLPGLTERLTIMNVPSSLKYLTLNFPSSFSFKGVTIQSSRTPNPSFKRLSCTWLFAIIWLINLFDLDKAETSNDENDCDDDSNNGFDNNDDDDISDDDDFDDDISDDVTLEVKVGIFFDF